MKSLCRRIDVDYKHFRWVRAIVWVTTVMVCLVVWYYVIKWVF